MPDADPILRPTRRPVNWRSLALGLVGIVLIAAITGYNDYVVNNTNVIGSHLPTGLLGYFLVFILLVNGPLWRWAPRYALRSDELAVALGIALVGCAIPSVGMMRYLPGHLTAFFHYASTSPADYNLLKQLNLPDWLFPTFPSADPIERGNHAIVQHFIGRAPVDDDTFLAHLRAVPWHAWVTPAIAWGIFFACLFGAILCLGILLRRQWVENERLPFPLASIFLALVETPDRSGLNSLFRSRGFWLAAAAVFAVHSANSLGLYYPRYFPEIPVGYNLEKILSQPPFVYIEWSAKVALVFFTIVGLVVFLQSSVAFSIWFIYAVLQVVRMVAGSYSMDVSEAMAIDQTSGAIVPYALVILWVGRKHFAMVLRQMFRRPAPGDPQGRYLPYAAAGWGLLLCLLGLGAWLVAAGTSLVGAVVIILMLLLVYTVVARIVAETGLLYVLIPVPVSAPWSFALRQFGLRTTTQSYFFAALFSGMLVHDTRESLPGYAVNALRVADDAAYPAERSWRRAFPFFPAMILALVVSYLVAGSAYLYTHYTYAATIDRTAQSPINAWGSFQMPRQIVLDNALSYMPPRTGPNVAHDRQAHFLFGASVSAFLGTMRLRYATWPLHPAGFILVHTWGIQRIWFSVFLGWLAKVLIVRFGGARLFVQSRPVFIGLIIGEAGAAAFWLALTLIRASMGLETQSIRFLPF